MSLTIATWNIAGARPIRSSDVFDYEGEDVGYFVEKLKTINPDIVCLQETHMNATRSVAKEIAEKLGGYSYYETAMSPSHVDEEYELGNAILAKENALSNKSFIFPYPSFELYLPGNKPAARHDKRFQLNYFNFGLVVNLQMLPLKFLGTPYDSVSGKEFASNMEDVLIDHLEKPLLFCGDFNTENAPTLYERLLKRMGMKNALPNIPTRPNGKRSDYIFYSDNFRLVDSSIIETNTDHYLCWARFE